MAFTSGAEYWADALKKLRSRSFSTDRKGQGLWALLQFIVVDQTVQSRGPLRLHLMNYSGATVYSGKKTEGKVQLLVRSRKYIARDFLYIVPFSDWPYTVEEITGGFKYQFADMSKIYGPKTTAVIRKNSEAAYSDYQSKTDKASSSQAAPRIFGKFAGSPVRPAESWQSSCPRMSHTHTGGFVVKPPYVYTSHTRTHTSVRTPGFRTKKGSQLPVNPHTVEFYEDDEPGVMVKYYKTYAPTTYWGYILDRSLLNTVNYLPPGPQHNAAVLNKAISNVVKNAQLDIQANLAQDFAQINQTVRLIGNTMNRIIGSIGALKRGNFPGAIQALVDGTNYTRRLRNAKFSPTSSLARNWLELQYGWKPLLKDVDGSMRSTAQLIAQDRSIQLVRGSSNMNLQTRGLLSGLGGNPGEWEVNTRHSARIGFRYKIDDHLKAYLAQTGFTNPINLAWEILPFSFVVDWFLPIGPYLETISSFDGLSFLDGYQTQFTKQVVHANWHRPTILAPGSPNEVTHEWAGSHSRVWWKLDRQKLTTFPKSRVPKLKNPISTTHALNALALLRVVFGR